MMDALNEPAGVRVASSDALAHLDRLIEAFVAQLPGPATMEMLMHDDRSLYIDWSLFACNEYEAVLNLVLERFDRNWPKSTRLLFQPEANYDFVLEAFGALTSRPNGNRKLAELVPILESMLRSDTQLFAAFVDLSNNETLPALENTAWQIKVTAFVQMLISVPNRVANAMHRAMPELFRPHVYSGRLLTHWLHALYFVANVNYVNKRPVYTPTFLAALFSRIVINFHNNHASKHLIATIRILGEWSRLPMFEHILPQLFHELSAKAIDVVSLFLLEHTTSLAPILGGAVLNSLDWRYCLTTAIPLQNYFASDKLTKHLVDYLSSFHAIVDELLSQLLDVWKNKTCIQRAVVEQRIYITKLIVLIVTAQQKNKVVTSRLMENKYKICEGVTPHLELSHQTIRWLGMICAELVLGILEPDAEETLTFEYVGCSNEDRLLVEYLRDITQTYDVTPDCDVRPLNVEAIFKELLSESVEIVAVAKKAPVAQVKSTVQVVPTTHEIQDLDSDDDLEPYDMSNDLPEAAKKAPLYLLDVKDGLHESTDPDVFNESVRVCAQLVYEQLANDDASVGLDILDSLIGLDNKFNMDNFEQLRMDACVAIVSVYPKESATFLLREFNTHAGTYNISCKVLMLDILGVTAKQLAQLNEPPQQSTAKQSGIVEMPRKIVRLADSSERVLEAQQVIRQRVELKTRRFATRTAHPHKLAKRNRFADVAGYFFFPLLYGVGERKLPLHVHQVLPHDVDDVLLITMLHTLATVTLAAQNCPLVPKMAAEIFRLSIKLRYSSESRIRLAVMQLIAVALIVAPAHVLNGDLFDDLCELRIWLADSCQRRADVTSGIMRVGSAAPRAGGGESNEECRQMAAHVLALCVDRLT